MPVPRERDLQQPVLSALTGSEKLSRGDLLDRVAEAEHLTAEDRQERRASDPKRLVFDERIANVLTSLKRRGLVTNKGIRGSWRLTDKGKTSVNQKTETNPPRGQSSDKMYSVDDILKEGCFLPKKEIVRLQDRLRTKGNLILQGSPGTGKTWIAKRLAFSLIGKRDNSKIRVVQFHPNLSYEDFVRGWRPDSDGQIRIADGVFLEAMNVAKENKSSPFVVVIEEINRGNPIQIFGEMLTLLERDKRTEDEALELIYPDTEGKKESIHIPENLYVIGTMNIADRSLALVDFALRRRFAFATLEPKLGSVWRKWIIKHRGVDPTLASDMERRISELNHEINESLGKQFRIGHSYVTPVDRIEIGSTKDWFMQVVETEIFPLLEEYWFDQPEKAREERGKLLKDW